MDDDERRRINDLLAFVRWLPSQHENLSRLAADEKTVESALDGAAAHASADDYAERLQRFERALLAWARRAPYDLLLREHQLSYASRPSRPSPGLVAELATADHRASTPELVEAAVTRCTQALYTRKDADKDAFSRALETLACRKRAEDLLPNQATAKAIDAGRGSLRAFARRLLTNRKHKQRNDPKSRALQIVARALGQSDDTIRSEYRAATDAQVTLADREALACRMKSRRRP